MQIGKHKNKIILGAVCIFVIVIISLGYNLIQQNMQQKAEIEKKRLQQEKNRLIDQWVESESRRINKEAEEQIRRIDENTEANRRIDQDKRQQYQDMRQRQMQDSLENIERNMNLR